jgi:hypothetical protein
MTVDNFPDLITLFFIGFCILHAVSLPQSYPSPTPVDIPVGGGRNEYKGGKTDLRKAIGASSKGRGYIYAWQDPDQPSLIKIGRAKNWQQRINAFQTAVPKPIKLVCVVRVRDDVYAEDYIHDMWEHLHIKAGGGTEWFHWSRDLERYLKSISDAIRR